MAYSLFFVIFCACNENMIKKGYIETSYGLIHYRATGEKENPHVLLLHQTASSSEMFEAIMNLLADRFYFFAPDTLGFGNSDFPRETATIKLYADSLREACVKFGLQTPFIFGHHTGASIAVQMEFDQKFARKMFLSGPPYLTEDQKEAFKKSIQPIKIKKDGTHLLKLWQRLRDKDKNADVYLTHREFLLNLRAGERYHEAYFAVFNHDFENQLATLDCPILVTAGDKDTLKDSLEPAYKALKNGEMRRLTGNTYICDQSPEVIAGLMTEFFC
jgi:pimeloyl-ACP methyl ester carboxylesterase